MKKQFIAYRDYLLSKHWIDFRNEILARRYYCQRCGLKRNKYIPFNIHHINYKNIGNETDKDIIVLCQNCHNKTHHTKKWTKKYKNKKDLNFIRCRNESDKIYNISNVFLNCRRCGGSHSVFYKRFKNGKVHLYMACPNSKPRTMAIKFIPNLDIPTL